jgi:preprotein translocase SecE subunit
VRLVTLGAATLLGLFGGNQIYAQFSDLANIFQVLGYAINWGHIVGVGVFLVFLLGGLWAVNYPRFVDLLIDTENELKRVSWPTWRQVFEATGVVITVVVIMSIFIIVVDIYLIILFLKLIGLL